MDEIQRKLALIDEQLTRGGLRRRLVGTAPLLFPAVGLMTGIVLQDGLLRDWSTGHPALALWLWLTALLAMATAICVWAARCRPDLRPEGFAYATLLGFTCLGAIRLLAYERVDARDIRHVVGQDRVLATVRGRVLTEPYLEQQDWCFASLVPADPSSAFYLKLDRFQTTAGWEPVVGTIRVQVDEPVPNLKIGDSIQVYCWLHRFEEPTNPGQFNFARYLRLRNVFVGASVPVREAITASVAAPPNTWLRLRRLLTDGAARGLLGHPFSETQSEAMLEALLLGQRQDIDRATNEAFRRTGLLHLISLSGMHMALLIVVIWWFSKIAGLSKPLRALVCVVASGVFLLIVPSQAPILRAAVTVWVYCLAVLLRRRSHPLNSLSLAVLVLLLWQPLQLLDVGWQLSFAGVVGILEFTPRVQAFIHRRTRDWFHPMNPSASTSFPRTRRIGDVVINVMSMSVAAWFASAGILLYHFYNVTPLASVWTAFASPPVTMIVVLGFVKIVLASFLPTVSLLLGHVLHGLAGLLIWMVEIMARIDFSYLQIGHVPLWLIVLYYVLVLSTAYVQFRRPLSKRILCTALALTVVLPLGVLKWQRVHRDHLCLTCLDVGHGQAIVAQLPGTMNLLFDAGSLYGKDVGARIVVPFLDYAGLGRLYAIIASHHDVDHINGIPEVVDLRRVERVCLGDMFLAPAPLPQTVELLTQHLATSHAAVEHVPQTIAAGAARIQVLWPVGESTTSEGLSENDQSLVCLIEFAGRRVLLCSDIEKAAQREILTRYPSLRADVVVAPHHGSVRTLDPDFLAQLAPRILLCSCGRTDYEQGRVVRKPEGVTLLVTARDGAATLCLDKAGIMRMGSAIRPDQ